MQLTTSPPPIIESFDALVRSADAPAHEALRLARASIVHTLARGAIGVLALSASALALALLRQSPREAVDVLSLVVEALLTVAPVTLVVTVWSAIATPRVMMAALALGVLTAGWVALGLVPLAAFTALVAPPAHASTAGLAALDAFALLLVITTLGSVALVLKRVLVAIDPGAMSRLIARAFGLAAFGVFFVRAQPWLARMTQELRAW